jgi:hypothetical protein
VVVLLLPPSTGGVVVEDPTLRAAFVVAPEQRDHHQSLDRQGEIPPDHLGQPVGLALQREPIAGDLLVVLELQLEQLHDLDGLARCAGDGDHREIVGSEDLLHLVLGDGVPLGGAAVTGQDHAAAELHAEDRGAVRAEVLRGGRDGHGPGELGMLPHHEVEEARVRTDGATGRDRRRERLVPHSPPFWT